MSLRQHTPLVLTSADGTSHRLAPVSLQLGRTGGGYDEAWIRDLVFAHPAALPVGEIEPSFGPLIPVCTELDTRTAGFADALFLNPLGMPTLVECKLWRNPEARREVVGQILDYASVLRRWTFADLQREAARARREQGFDLSAHIQEHGGSADFDEAAFVDNVTRNLAQGRLLLLVVGDGIRAGVETIADYIQGTTGLHFTLGLVEMQAFELGDGRRIVQPRVLTKTLIVNRTVVDLAQPGLTVTQDGSADDVATSREHNRDQRTDGGRAVDAPVLDGAADRFTARRRRTSAAEAIQAEQHLLLARAEIGKLAHMLLPLKQGRDRRVPRQQPEEPSRS